MRAVVVFGIESGEDVIGEVLEGGEVFGGAERDFLKLVGDVSVGRLAGSRMLGRRDGDATGEIKGLRHDSSHEARVCLMHTRDKKAIQHGKRLQRPVLLVILRIGVS